MVVAGVVRQDPLPNGARVETIVRADGTDRSYLTRIVGGRYDGDDWSSATRTEALRTHVETLAIFGRKR